MTYSRRIVAAYFNNFQCTGSENNLLSCPHSTNYCFSHVKFAGAKCEGNDNMQKSFCNFLCMISFLYT